MKTTNKVAGKIPCACFVAGTEVVTPEGGRDIDAVAVGDVVLAFDEDAVPDAPWQELVGIAEVLAEPSGGEGRGGPLAFDARRGRWVPLQGEVPHEGTWWSGGQLWHASSGVVTSRGRAPASSLTDGTVVWTPRRLPAPRAGDVVWVVDDPQAGPWRLAELTQTLTGPTQVSYLGTVFEVAREGEGVWVRRTPQVLSVVSELLPGRSERLVEATWSVGEQVDGVVGTPEHPFYVPELGWVPLGELTVGMELHTAQGSGALLVGSTWWPEEVADFNLEVAEKHTYFVRGAGVDAVGVLVHNACGISPQARGRASESRVLGELGLPKNTRKVSSTEGNSIPDGISPDDFVEVKDTQRVSNTRQLRIQRTAAAAEDKGHVVVTGTNTKVSKTVEQQSTVIRRDDLGPQ